MCRVFKKAVFSRYMVASLQSPEIDRIFFVEVGSTNLWLLFTVNVTLSAG